jgi:hypothetical protein
MIKMTKNSIKGKKKEKDQKKPEKAEKVKEG